MVSLKKILTMNMAKNIYFCLTGAGVVVFMFYCMRINFFPTGMSLSDVIFFLMVIISFSLFLLFFLACWYSMSIVLSWVFIRCSSIFSKKIDPSNVKLRRRLRGINRITKILKFYDPMSAYICLSIIGGFISFAAFKSNRIDIYLFILSVSISSLCIILALGIYFDKRIKKENKSKKTLSIISMTIIIFFLISDMIPLLSDAAMNLIGIRKSNITVILQGTDLNMARHLSGNQGQIYFKGDALFTGVGNTSLLVINHKRIVVRNENLALSY